MGRRPRSTMPEATVHIPQNGPNTRITTILMQTQIAQAVQKLGKRVALGQGSGRDRQGMGVMSRTLMIKGTSKPMIT